MDYKDIISSGILESYVLGTASSEEISMIQKLISVHPEIEKEIEAIENVLISEAELNAPELSETLKHTIKSKLDFNINKQDTKIVVINPVKEKSFKSYSYAIAATVALLVVSSMLNVIFYKKLQTANTELAQIETEKTMLAQQMEVQQTSLSNTENKLSILSNPNNTIVRLNGLKDSVSSAFVYWNKGNQKVYVAFTSLPQLPTNKQYQLWVLLDGKPIDMGVFDAMDDTQMQLMKNIDKANAFAVTIENKGGSPTPTMESLILLGNV